MLVPIFAPISPRTTTDLERLFGQTPSLRCPAWYSRQRPAEATPRPRPSPACPEYSPSHVLLHFSVYSLHQASSVADLLSRPTERPCTQSPSMNQRLSSLRLHLGQEADLRFFHLEGTPGADAEFGGKGTAACLVEDPGATPRFATARQGQQLIWGNQRRHTTVQPEGPACG